MNILLSNDDGIHAKGIEVLHDAVLGLGHIDIVAPDSERSAVGHAITISDPLRAIEVCNNGKHFGTAVSGTPADCVKLATCTLLEHKPDFVFSGINLGPNAGISVIYSGTVSAATEGTILGYHSVAFSLATFTEPCWETAQYCARYVAERILAHPPPPDCLINVNIPNIPVSAIRGYKVTRTCRSRFKEKFQQHKDPHGRTHYWLDGDIEILNDLKQHQDETDLQALKDGYVSLTPLQLDHTALEYIPTLRSSFL